MDLFIKIAIVLVLLGFVFLLFQLRTVPKDSVKEKKVSDKKQEIIDNYKKRLKTELSVFKNNQEKLNKYKIALLKDISQELSRNIFFEKDEIKSVIKELASMPI
jgi:uncharacterized membrane-anchored protein YhcB (DUF1043 family)